MKKGVILTIVCALSLFTNDCFAKVRVNIEEDTTLVFSGSGRLKPSDTTWIDELTTKFPDLNWDNITKIAFTGSAEYTIDAAMFKNCNMSNLKCVSLYKSKVVSVGDSAFANNQNLANIIIGQFNENTVFGKGVFAGCPKLTTVGGSKAGVSLLNCVMKNEKGNSVTYKINAVPENLCNGMEYLEIISVPAQLTEVKKGAFSNCANLTKAEIPDMLTTIGDEAFKDCKNLISLKYKASSTDSETGAKIYNYNLQTIGSSVFENDENFAKFSGTEYSANNNAFIIPETVTSIGKNIFKGCDCVKYVGTTSKANVQLLGSEILDNTFSGAESLLEVRAWPAGITKIGNSAFENCTSLCKFPSQKTPGSITAIGNFAFSGCSSMDTLSTSNATLLTYIGESAFASTALHAFNLPASVTTMGKNIFYGCSGLTNVITKLGKGATDNYVLVSGSVIPAHAFDGMNKLKNIYFSVDKVTTIGDSAFANCSKLKYVKVSWISNLDNLQVASNAFDYTNTEKVVRDIITLSTPIGYAQDYCEYSPWNNMDIFNIENAEIYERTVNENTMSTICMPYAFYVPKYMTVYEIVGIKNQSGKSSFCVESVDDLVKTEPGRPYLFRCKGTKNLKFYKLTGRNSVVAEEPVSVEETKGLVGKFESEIIPLDDAENSNYIYKSNTLYHVTTAVKTGNNKAYINMNLVPVIDGDLESKNYFVMDFEGFDGETSINDAVSASNSLNEVYNLSGQKVKAISKSGVYIVNGKKFYINK